MSPKNYEPLTDETLAVEKRRLQTELTAINREQSRRRAVITMALIKENPFDVGDVITTAWAKGREMTITRLNPKSVLVGTRWGGEERIAIERAILVRKANTTDPDL